MDIGFTYSSGGVRKNLVLNAKETGVTYNYSQLKGPWYQHGVQFITPSGLEGRYYQQAMLVGGSLNDYPFARWEYMPVAVRNQVTPFVNWADESNQLVMRSGMENFFAPTGTPSWGSSKTLSYGDNNVGKIQLNFGLYTDPVQQVTYGFNSAFSYSNPNGYASSPTGWGGQNSNTGDGYVINDAVHEYRPNLMFLALTMHDDEQDSQTYGQDFPVVMIIRHCYGSGESNPDYDEFSIMDVRLFSDSVPISQSTTQGNTPTGWTGKRDDYSDSDTESVIGTAINSFVNQVKHGTHLYRMDKTMLGDFFDFLWSRNIWDEVANTKYNPIRGILSLHLMPTHLTGTSLEAISVCGRNAVRYNTLGTSYTAVQGTVTADSTKMLKSDTFKPAEYSGSFLDWGANTRCKLRIPFVGVVPIDTNMIMVGGVYLKYNIDFITGNCLVQVYTKPDVMGNESDDCLCMIAQYSGNCAWKLNVSTSDFGGGTAMGSIVNGIIGFGAGMGNGIVGLVDGNNDNFFTGPHAVIGGAASLARGIAGAMLAQHQNAVNGATPNADCMGMRQAALIIERPIDLTPLERDANGNIIPDVYSKFNGRPSASGGKVKDYKTGYVDEVFIKGILHADTLYATEAEKNEIEAAFAKGVYI